MCINEGGEELTELSLSEREREEVVGYIQRGQKLPPKYKALLFEQPRAAELIWPGKTSEVTNVVLPFQQIEQIDEPRREGSDFADLFAWDRRTGRQTGGWTNKLIWGDNKLALSSLKNGPLRRQIDDAGGLKLVYIDPPFDVGADFSFEIDIGDDALIKEPSLIEEVAYAIHGDADKNPTSTCSTSASGYSTNCLRPTDRFMSTSDGRSRA